MGFVLDTDSSDKSKSNKVISGGLQHKELSFCTWAFCFLCPFLVLSLETEFVHQGQIALNLFDVWSCTLSGTQRYLPLEYDI